MRIGLDVLGAQSPSSRGRGIGRYLQQLAGALLESAPTHEIVFLSNRDLPPPDLRLERERASLRPVPRLGSREGARLASVGLDVLVVGSPFEYLADGDVLPDPDEVGVPVACIVYDVIPWLFPERYLADPSTREEYVSRLRQLSRLSLLLTISGATRRDVCRALALPPERVQTIGCASDPRLFHPPSGPPDPRERATLAALGIDGPFVLSVSGMDERKNHRGLLEAFSRLPQSLRQGHRVVFAHEMHAPEREHLCGMAARFGVGEETLLAGRVDDATLRLLYQRCRVFALPSEYEGFGLPILEAMMCGSPVVAGNNSAQVEVGGHAALLVEPRDVGAIADALRAVLESAERRSKLSARGLLQARSFDWRDCAERAVSALARLGSARRPAAARRASRPRLAVLSPLPPQASGVADYAVRLVRELEDAYAVDLFHEETATPFASLDDPRVGVYDQRAFDVRHRQLAYDAVLYQMGNSHFHGFVYERLLAVPGVVTLHDLGLSGFHLWYSGQPGAPPDHFAREITRCLGDEADRFRAAMDEWRGEDDGLWGALRRRRVYLNRRVLEAARRVVVHSHWCVDEAGRTGEATRRMVVIPFPVDAARLPPGRRAHVRRALGLPQDSPVVGVFGIMHPSKLNREAVLAFADAVDTRRDSLLVFAGRDLDTRALRESVTERGLGARVRFFVNLAHDAFADLAAAVDVGLSLREPPSNGETSAALMQLLGAGVPTIASAVDALASLPDEVVLKVDPQKAVVPQVSAGLRRLLGDPAAARALGERALRHVEREHSWARVGALYRAQIDAVIVEDAVARAGGGA
jgi:glycosyltransferase involved in cell wall biosynthesis